jgi:galactokinase/mevalonate kinase-like predicted kinase
MFKTSYDFLEYILLWWTGFRRCNQNPYTEEEQTTQRQKEKIQKDIQRSTKHTYKTKDRVTQNPLKTESELK